MKKQILKANEYYHAEHPGSHIFYKLKDGYVLFGEGAFKIGALLNIRPAVLYGLFSISIRHSDFLERVDILNSCGIGYRAISYLNDEGELAVPDVDVLRSEKEFDY